MTKLEKATINAIKSWCENNIDDCKVRSIRHVHPRAYVLGRVASCCIAVATPPMDAEPQIRKVKYLTGADGSNTVNLFDGSLKTGSWCSMARVRTDGFSQSVAIKAVELDD